MGRTVMTGLAGKMKRVEDAVAIRATSIQIDNLNLSGVCMLKVDVEGNEPSVLSSAKQLISQTDLPYIQFELTRTITNKQAAGQYNIPTCANVKTLEHLAAIGFELTSIPWSRMSLPLDLAKRPFPSQDTNKTGFGCKQNPLRLGYLREFALSLNFVASRTGTGSGMIRKWPKLACPMGPSPIMYRDASTGERLMDCFQTRECDLRNRIPCPRS